MRHATHGGSEACSTDATRGGHASGVDYAALSVGGAEAVAAWLAALGMGEYSDAFAHAAVDGKALPLREIAEM